MTIPAKFKVGDRVQVTSTVLDKVETFTGEVTYVNTYESMKPDYDVVLPDGSLHNADADRGDKIELISSASEIEYRTKHRVRFSFNSQTHGYYFSEWFETREAALNFKMFVDQSAGVRFEDIETEEEEEV